MEASDGAKRSEDGLETAPNRGHSIGVRHFVSVACDRTVCRPRLGAKGSMPGRMELPHATVANRAEPAPHFGAWGGDKPIATLLRKTITILLFETLANLLRPAITNLLCKTLATLLRN